MVSTARRITAAFLAVFFAVAGVVYPVSASAATYNAASNLSGRSWYVPAQGLGIAGNAVVASAATIAARANPWIAALTLGTPIMQHLLEMKQGGNIAIRAKDAPFATPNGWTTDALGPLPPVSIQMVPAWQVCGASCTGYSYGTALAACKVRGADQTLGSCTATQNGSCSAYNCNGSGGGYAYLGAGCPDGYSASSGACALNNRDSVKWPADGIPTLQPNSSGTGLEASPRDPDPLPSNPTITEIQNPSNNYAPDEFGQPSSISITPQSGGGYKVDQRVQTTVNNQTTTTINNYTVNNAGTVINVSTTTVPGPIELASPTATPVGSSGSPTINFPTDYNREATQQQAVQKLEDLKQGTGSADAPNYQQDTNDKKASMNQELKDKAEAIPGQYTADKGNWFSWVWTPPVGQCEPWTNTIHGQTVSWNVCPYIAKIRDVIGYLLAIGTTWGVYLQLFRRED